MPEPRSLDQSQGSGFDSPPANNASSYYLVRQQSLSRALHDTNDLAPRGSAGSTPPPRTYFTRVRRRLDAGVEAQRDQTSARGFPESTPGSPARSPSTTPRSSKRRKLNDDRESTVRSPIKYGHEGQVVPGKLRLEIISNDGGEHFDHRNPDINLGADNVLSLDASVYCSERKTSSIMFRQQDRGLFSLVTFHAVAPKLGFTAPMNEGVAYIAMQVNDLQPYLDPPYHARRVHPPVGPNAREADPSPRPRSLDQAVFQRGYSRETPQYRARMSETIRTNTERETRRSAMAEVRCEIPESTDILNPEHPNNTRITLSSSFSSPDHELASAPSSPRGPVATLTDEEAGPEEVASNEFMAYRTQRMRTESRRRDLESWDSDERWSGLNDVPSDEPRLDGIHNESPLWDDDFLRHSTRAYTPHHPSGLEPPTYTTPIEAGVKDHKVHMARFKIEKGKHKVAVKFDPPVSGRYLLVKVWSGPKTRNVDVQSLVAKGFAGPRFMPAAEPK